ncbi:MAG: hypothetical protein QME50_05885 [Candidatus Bathyarchaeota archaeon]|nr:hypothetical protein [Candidatus Bathyarchaeota archaeon]
MMEKVERKKIPIKWVAVGVVIGMVIIASLILLYSPLLRIINPPKPEITSTYGHDGFQGLNYVCYVEVTVRNNGGDGWIKVFAEISGAGKYEKQEQRVYQKNGESKDLTFVFDISFWGALFSSMTYRAWAVAD